MNVHRKLDKTSFDDKHVEHANPPQQLSSNLNPNDQVPQQPHAIKCSFNLSPTIDHSIHLKSVSSCSSPMLKSTSPNTSYLSSDKQQDATNDFDSTFLSKQAEHTNLLQQLSSNLNPNDQALQQCLIDKSKSNSSNKIKESSDTSIIHFNNLSILDPTQFDKTGFPDKIPYKIEVTNSVISYYMRYYNINDEIIVFSSDSYPLDWLNSAYAIKKVMILPGYPDKRKEWNYTYLSCLLNELIMFQSVPQN